MTIPAPLPSPMAATAVVPPRRRTFEDKAVGVLTRHAGKVYLGLLAFSACIVTLRTP